MKYDLVIWDIDGTLLNTEEGLVCAYQYAIDKLHLPSKSINEIKSFIGPVPQTIFIQQFAMTSDKAQNAANIFRDRYKNHDLLKAYIYDGILEVLQKINTLGIKQAIATNKRQDYATDICKHFGIDKFCEPILGPDNVTSKTKADLIKDCILATNSQIAVMIGDTNSDKQAAEIADVDFIGVNYGFGFSNVKNYANTPKDILRKLEIIN